MLGEEQGRVLREERGEKIWGGAERGGCGGGRGGGDGGGGG